jgi:hypothetical protein
VLERFDGRKERGTMLNGQEMQEDREVSDQEIRSLLGVPDGYSVLNLVAIGEKGEEKRPYTDADLHTENVHYEKY